MIKNKITKDSVEPEGKLLKNILLVFSVLFLVFFSFFAVTITRQINKLTKIKTISIHRKNNVILENKIKKITDGYPIENMSYFISTKDEKVAAFMVAIAKKESNWGKRTPKLNGRECFNYWGYRQKRELMGSGGHTCFNNPKDAVETVSKRIQNLLAQGIDTPQEMVVWKCGYSCKNHSNQSVSKWIQDVNLYYQKFQ